MKIIRNSAGNLINIGKWDYQILVKYNSTIVNNLLSKGAYKEDAEVVVGYDDKLYLATN